MKKAFLLSVVLSSVVGFAAQAGTEIRIVCMTPDTQCRVVEVVKLESSSSEADLLPSN